MRSLLVIAISLLATLPLSAQLSGSYTVNGAWPNGGGNYLTLGAAVADLIAQGVAGPTEFLLFDDNGPYTEANLFPTNNVAWSTSTAVLVLGTWSGASATNRVAFRAAPGEIPVFDAVGQAMGVFWNGADYATLEGVEIRNADFDGISLYSEAQHGQVIDAVIRRCNVHDCAAAGVTIYGNTPNPLNTLIENCFFWNLQTTNAGGFNSTARFGYISSRRQIGTRVNHNTFYVSSSAGSGFCVLGANPGGGGVWAEVRNNIIVKTSNSGRPIYSWPVIGTAPGTPTVCEDNCYRDLSGGNFATHGTLSSPDLATWSATTSLDLNSIDADPLLVSPSTGDLHIQPTSPCVDAAYPWPIALGDFDAQNRNGIPDIGADEYLNGAPAAATSTGSGYTIGGGSGPILSTSQVPFIGNSNFQLDLSQAPANTPVLLFAAFQLADPVLSGLDDLPNFFLDLDSCILLMTAGHSPVGPNIANVNGTTVFPAPIPANSGIVGFEMAFQAAIYTGFNPVAVSNAIHILVN